MARPLSGKLSPEMGSLLRRGEIRWVDLEPGGSHRGPEANTRRPAVIVSNDRANAVAERLGRGVVTIVPLTSNVDRIYPFPALVRAIDSGLPNDSKAQAEQVRTMPIERVGPLLGRVPVATMAALDDALRLHLQL